MTESTADTADESMTDHFDADAETVTEAWEGAFIYATWGYGQTNTEFAQIVGVSDSGKTVQARMVAAERVDGHGQHDELRPTADQHGDTFRLHVRESRGDPVFRGSYPYIDGDAEKGTRLGTFTPFGDAAGETVLTTRTGFGH